MNYELKKIAEQIDYLEQAIDNQASETFIKSLIVEIERELNEAQEENYLYHDEKWLKKLSKKLDLLKSNIYSLDETENFDDDEDFDEDSELDAMFPDRHDEDFDIDSYSNLFGN